MPTVSRTVVVTLLACGFLAACTASPFPDCCDLVGDRDVPYATTYRFNFRTGAFDITDPNPDRLFGILSQADILTLMNAAGITQLTSNGLITGTLNGPRGPLREASLIVTDAAGTVISLTSGVNQTFFYNSLGQVPDFLNIGGTSDQGSFTLFNAPPGEYYVQLVGGGRGNGRITAYSSAVSIGRFSALEVSPTRIGILGDVLNPFTGQVVPNTQAAFFGRSDNPFVANDTGIFVLSQENGLPTQGVDLLGSLFIPNSRKTFYRFQTSISAVNARQQAFDPITIPNLNLYTETGLQGWAARAGVVLPPPSASSMVIAGRVNLKDGTGVSGGVVVPTDGDGQPLSNQGIRAFYFGFSLTPEQALDPLLTRTTVDSRYVLFIPDCADIHRNPDGTPNPDNTIYLNVVSKTINLPPVLETGRASVPCKPGSVFVQNLDVQDFPSSLFPTVSLQGRVSTEDGVEVVGAQLEVLGAGKDLCPHPPPDTDLSCTTDSSGNYSFPRGTAPDPDFEIEGGAPLLYSDIVPLLAFSPYTVKISKSGFLTTYNPVTTGLDGVRLNMTLLQRDLCGTSSTMKIYGVVRDLGIVDPTKNGLPAQGISVAILDESGTPVGRVIYPDDQGNPSTQLQTSLRGKFAVCDLPPYSPVNSLSFPNQYQIQVTSQDDSGAIPVQIFDDGVTLVDFLVNKAIPRTISTTGQVMSLLGPEGTGALPVSGATISVLGTTLQRTTDSTGRFDQNVPLPSNGQYVVRTEKAGHLPTYNYQVTTPGRLRQDGTLLTLPPLSLMSTSDLDRAGIPWSSSRSIVAGKTVIPGFGTATTLSPNLGAPIRLFPGFFNLGDSFSDVLAVYDDSVKLFYGDGIGALLPPQTISLSVGAPLHIQAAETADFNQDGHVDLAVIGNQQLFIFLGNDAGGFEAGQAVPFPPEIGGAPLALTVQDLDGDGLLDLLVATNGAKPIVRFINKSGTSFILNAGDPAGDTCASKQPVAITIEALLGTGLNDIVVADQDKSLCVYPMNTDGSVLAMKLLTLPSRAISLTPSFLDSDTISDIVILHQTGISALLGVPTQNELSPLIDVPLPNGFAPTALLTGDGNFDGREDVLVSGQGGILYLLGAGNGRFNAPTVVSTAPAAQLAVADLDGNGRDDLIANQTGDASLVEFPGQDLPGPGVQLQARDETGNVVGQVVYLNDQGQVQPQAGATTSSGRFLIYNLPPGFVMVRVAAGASGNALLTAYPGSTSFTPLSVNPVPGTVTVVGQTIDPLVTDTSGIVAEGIRVNPLGTGTEVTSSTGGGTADPTSAAFQLPLDANSEYIVKLRP